MESVLVWKTGRERKKETHMQTDRQKVDRKGRQKLETEGERQRGR